LAALATRAEPSCTMERLDSWRAVAGLRAA